MAHCRTCDEEVIWTKTVNGKSMPVDATPVDDGDFYLVDEGESHPTAYYFVAMFPPTAEDGFDGFRYHSHFASCTSADLHRKR